MKLKLFIFGAIILFLNACATENKVDEQKVLLAGHWDLVEGQKDGKIAEALTGTYFEFTKDGKMSTNLPLKGGMDSTYEIKDGVIIQKIVNDLEVKYTIQELTESSLRLATTLRGYDFNFAMQKANLPEKLSLLDSSSD